MVVFEVVVGSDDSATFASLQMRLSPESVAPLWCVPLYTFLMSQPPPVRWLSLARAAQILGESPESLRKKLGRAARRAVDGAVEAEVDGIRARKLGRNWKVRLSEEWMR